MIAIHGLYAAAWCVQSNSSAKHLSMDIRLYLELPGKPGTVDPSAPLYEVRACVCSPTVHPHTHTCTEGVHMRRHCGAKGAEGGRRDTGDGTQVMGHR